MVSHNGMFFKQGNVYLSTVQLPISIGYIYESCIFTDEDSQVVGKYNSLSEAILDHVKLRHQYGLKEVNRG